MNVTLTRKRAKQVEELMKMRDPPAKADVVVDEFLGISIDEFLNSWTRMDVDEFRKAWKDAVKWVTRAVKEYCEDDGVRVPKEALADLKVLDVRGVLEEGWTFFDAIGVSLDDETPVLAKELYKVLRLLEHIKDLASDTKKRRE